MDPWQQWRRQRIETLTVAEALERRQLFADGEMPWCACVGGASCCTITHEVTDAIVHMLGVVAGVIRSASERTQ